jgi:hypothetical protein
VTPSQLSRASLSVQKEIQEVGERFAEHQRRQRKEEQAAEDPQQPSRRKSERKRKRPDNTVLKGNVEARVWRNGNGLDTYFTVDLVRYYSSHGGQGEAWSFRFEDISRAVAALFAAKKWIRRQERRLGKRRRSWWD